MLWRLRARSPFLKRASSPTTNAVMARIGIDRRRDTGTLLPLCPQAVACDGAFGVPSYTEIASAGTARQTYPGGCDGGSIHRTRRTMGSSSSSRDYDAMTTVGIRRPSAQSSDGDVVEDGNVVEVCDEPGNDQHEGNHESPRQSSA